MGVLTPRRNRARAYAFRHPTAPLSLKEVVVALLPRVVALAALVVFLLRRKQSRERAEREQREAPFWSGLPASPLKPSVLRRRSSGGTCC